jgi:hypothetical protein
MVFAGVAVAAEREDNPSLLKTPATWVATVFSLITSSEAMARLVLPVATAPAPAAHVGSTRPPLGEP